MSAWFALLLFAAVANAEPYGALFQVDTFTSPNLSTPSVASVFDMATARNGDSAVLWQSGTGDGTGYLQRYDVAGRALQGQEWAFGSGLRAVALGGTGNFALLRQASDGSGSGVFVSVFNRTGGMIIPEFRANATTAGQQIPTALAMNAAGQFAVAWQVSSAGAVTALYARTFAANGAPLGPETLLVSRAGSDYLDGAKLAIDAAGRSVASWTMGNLDAVASLDIWARRLDANGIPLGSVFRVNTRTDGFHAPATAAMNEAGAFVVAWSGPGTPGTTGIYAQLYAASGTPVGAELLVDTVSGTFTEGLDVAMGNDGGFVVTWQDPAGFTKVLGRAFNAAGVALGTLPYQISGPNSAFSTSCQIGMDRSGNTFVTWLQHHYQNDPNNAVLARRYAPAELAIQPLANGQIVSGLTGAANSWRYFKVSMPAGRTTFDASIFGGAGDADVYVRWGALPTLEAWDGRPYLNGNNETARMLNYPAGDFYIGINGFAAYSGLSATGSSR